MIICELMIVEKFLLCHVTNKILKIFLITPVKCIT